MPFKSEKQRRWMFANKPEMAKRWAAEYHQDGGQAGGWWNNLFNDVEASPMQVRNRQWNEYVNAGSPGKFQDWLDAGGGQNVSTTQPSFARSAQDVARIATPYGSLEDAYSAGQNIAAGNYGAAAADAGMAAAGFLPFVRPAARAVRAAPLAGTAARHMDPDYARLALDEFRGLNRPGRSVGASALYDVSPSNTAKLDEVAEASGIPANRLKSTMEGAQAEVDALKSRAKKGNPGAQDKIDDYKAALGDNWEATLKDMELEAKYPDLAVNRRYGPLARVKSKTEGFDDWIDKQGRTRRGTTGKFRSYRNYRTPGGENVHAVYGEPFARGNPNKATPVNLLGGSDEALQRGAQGVEGTDLFPLGNSLRPAGEFDLIGSKGRPAKVDNAPNAHVKLSDRVTPRMSAPLEVIDDTAFGPRLPEFNPYDAHVQRQIQKTKSRGGGGGNKPKPKPGGRYSSGRRR